MSWGRSMDGGLGTTCFRNSQFLGTSSSTLLRIEHCNASHWVAKPLTRTILLCTPAGKSKLGTGDLYAKPLQRDEHFWTALIVQRTKCGQDRQALRMYEEMLKDGVEPSPRSVVTLIKACARLQNLESAKSIHAQVVRSGLQSDMYVATMLVDMYVKCKSLEDASQAFEKMSCRDVFSWNTMILGYVQMDKNEEALRLYTRMQQDGVTPHDRTYVSALKACSTIAESGDRNGGDIRAVKEKCLETVTRIHRDVLNQKSEPNLFVGTMLVDAYVKCRRLEDARRVFEKIAGRDVVCWNAMILGYAQVDQGAEALELYSRMHQEGVVPNGRTYISALKACSSLADFGDGRAVKDMCLEAVRAIHADVVKVQLETDLFVQTMLVDVYAKCGRLEEARCVFEKMSHRDVVSWTAIILGYAQMDKGEEALHLYSLMQMEGVVCDSWTYVAALKACSSLAAESGESNGSCSTSVKERCLKSIRAIHMDIMKGKFEKVVYVGTMLVDAYSKCGSLQDARVVFESMLHRSIASWNAMILGYAQMEKGDEALQLYERMQQEGLVPDGRTYVGVLKACSALVESRAKCEGTLVQEKCLETVRSIHTAIVRQNLESDVFVGTMLVNVYANCGSLAVARCVFETIPRRDVVSWNAMILGYVQMEMGEEALQVYSQMQHEGVVPNARTYVGALSACGTVQGLERGREIHAQIVNGSLQTADCFMTASLINMYGKCGSMTDAQQVFDATASREIAAWNALIAGYAHQGESELVFELFSRMKQEGVQPDGITFLGLLTVCSHAGLVDKGPRCFEAMSREHGIAPTIKHFTCMVDLLGRAGQLEKAMEIVKAMPVQPDSALWECVMAACRKWGDVKFGRQAFECAVRLNEDNSAAYVLMSNIYAAAHMAEEAKQMQAMRVKSQAWKQPGQTRWTDVSGNEHGFVSGDHGHPHSQHIYSKLGDLVVKMSKEGYAAHLDSVLPDAADDECFGYSEQVAIAYALLNK